MFMERVGRSDMARREFWQCSRKMGGRGGPGGFPNQSPVPQDDLDPEEGEAYVPCPIQNPLVGRADRHKLSEDFVVAMLRSVRALGSRFLFACAVAIPLAVTGVAAENTPSKKTAAPPRLMRLPSWIESISERAAKEKKPDTIAESHPPVAAAPAAAAVEKAEATDGEGPVATLTAGVAELPAASKASEQPTADAEAKESLESEQPAPPKEIARPTKEESATEEVAAPVPAAPTESATLAIDPASFRGVYPGKTTRDELEAGWGPGEQFTREDGTAGLFWDVEPFERVEVVLDDGVVGSIRIKLVEPVPVKQLAEQLELTDVRTVSILDEKGISVGEVYPERGVVISVKPGTQSAVALLLEPLDAEAFVLRSEGELEENTALAQADLQYAVQIDPKHVRAQRMLLVVLTDQGRWQEALAVAESVAQLDQADVWTQLKHASVLLALGRTDEARAKVEAVKAKSDIAPLVTAQTARMLGRIELSAAAPDYQAAVKHFEEAIRTTAPLVTSDSSSIQNAARDVMLDAHLGTALAIAKGTWQQKGRVIPKWITRSETLVSESKLQGLERDQIEMHLCRGALAAAAGSNEGVESLLWVKRLLEVRERLGARVKDPARRQQIDWETGRGLADALTASLARGDSSDMLENATLTAAYLERGGQRRQLSDAERRDVGELLFRIGILHSLQKGDHATAVTWFDKVVPLWKDNPAFREAGDAGQLGESFVSMAISYWQVNRRDDALAISRKGVDLMVEAVDRKELDERALAVAYGNLSTMHAEEGDDEQSKNYAEMASRAEASGTIVK
jgi:tetratricopeptide (TPR) repeat protein